MKKLITSALLCAPLLFARAALFSQTYSGINAAIPDGNLAGLVNNQTISGAFGTISDVDVRLTISGTGFGAVNGDLYVYLTHDGGISILLNRSGRRADSSLGYDDNGYNNVLFDDSAANGDVHHYRFTLSGDNSLPLLPNPSPLTGSWAPDGRHVSPAVVLDSSPRGSSLSEFDGMDPNGEWTLFVADAAGGGTAQLDSWGLEITAVPEPVNVALGITGGLFAALQGVRCWKNKCSRPGTGRAVQPDTAGVQNRD